MPAPADVQTDTLNKFLAAWETNNIEDTVALWSDDFTQQLLPLSLGIPENSRAKAEIAYPRLMKNLTNWKVEVKNVVHDTARGTAVVYSTSLADTPVPGEKWTNEYGIFITFSEDGTRIKRLEEMIDSAFFGRFFPLLQQHFAKQAGAHQ
ncbi:hypothetical protein V8C43DRAFT_185909 [Trichoderma afarasin]